MIKLRPYQLKAIDAIKNGFRSKKRQYIEMPTGAGKTVTFLSYASANHERILIIVPSRQLLEQVYATSLLFYHKSEVSRKGDNFNETPRKLHICIIHSIRGEYLNNISQELFDLIIIDEAHHSQAESYKRFIKNCDGSPYILGVTATPDRLDGKAIDEILHECTFKLNIIQLINDGFLSDIEGYRVNTKIDISDIDSRNGDFSISQLFKRLCCNLRNNLILDLITKHMKGRKVLIFCINIQHTEIISRFLNSNGIHSAFIHGKQSKEIKNSTLKAFSRGDIDCLCNCQLLTEGFDEPSIDGIILARPTASKALYNQMIGRGLRIHPGKKNCKLIDIVDAGSSAKGFSCIVDDCAYEQMDHFDGIKQLNEYIEKRKIESAEFVVERINLFDSFSYKDLPATASTIKYLKKNNIQYDENLSVEEGSFLIWLNELKKEFYNGNHYKK